MVTVNKKTPTSRAGSIAHDILKRRNKPYKTEKNKILAKKRRLDLRTSYKNAPQGYTFLAVGTPDLAERCKELSRQQGLPVNVVNAKRASKFAENPEKVSHHIDRIGYHFRSAVVEKASEELGYIIHNGQFIKEAEVKARSRIARIMERHGIQTTTPSTQETPAQVRAAIKELFPKMPEQDLDEIVERAWKKGSHRVGTNPLLELPRRVQLATIARIRHAYTDYDLLLRAFEWKEARSIVEPECLHKLIQWRGENEDEDDELEEIVRETIVIDDDDDSDSNGSEADDEDSVSELEYPSDTSIAYMRRLADDEYLKAETPQQTAGSHHHSNIDQFNHRSEIARQKIGAVRHQMAQAASSQVPQASGSSTSVNVLQNGRGKTSYTIVHGVQDLHRVQPIHPEQNPADLSQYHFRQNERHDAKYTQPFEGHPALPLQFAARIPGYVAPYDRPIASIERNNEGRRTATRDLTYPLSSHNTDYTHHPAGPSEGSVDRWSRVYRPLHVSSDFRHQTHDYRSQREDLQLSMPALPNVIDLTTPEPREWAAQPRVDPAVRITIPDEGESYRGPSGRSHGFGTAPIRPLAQAVETPQPLNHYSQHVAGPIPYDPQHPGMHVSSDKPYEQVNASEYHLGPLQTTGQIQPRYQIEHRDDPYGSHGRRNPYSAQSGTEVVYLHSYPVPAPIHGAPAPVQQVSRRATNVGNHVPGNHGGHNGPAYGEILATAPVPINGAPHPAQPYYPS